ncbi:hypothetical protein [Candidatus Poriferisodalis sp.]|uniref:hypothetical protein n=1 Tax=Candidatus Poriferisodalis sp. TaxID=3101277 RepID=UPI003B01C070
MSVDLLADIYGVPIGSDDISQWQSLTNEVEDCFEHERTTPSTEAEHWRSFVETFACLQPVIHKSTSSKVIKTLLSPVTFLVGSITELWGYLNAGYETLTSQATATAKIHGTPASDDQSDGPESQNGLADTLGIISAVSAGWGHSCGLRTDGTATCWGDNRLGQADAPSGSFGSGNGDGRTVTLTQGGLGPTSLRPGEGIPCAPNTPTSPSDHAATLTNPDHKQALRDFVG